MPTAASASTSGTTSAGANDLAAIAALPAELVTGVQVSDGPRCPTTPTTTPTASTNRVAPGDGEFDVAGFVGALRSAGVDLPWSVEVCSTAGWADPAAHVDRIAAGMRRYLA